MSSLNIDFNPNPNHPLSKVPIAQRVILFSAKTLCEDPFSEQNHNGSHILVLGSVNQAFSDSIREYGTLGLHAAATKLLHSERYEAFSEFVHKRFVQSSYEEKLLLWMLIQLFENMKLVRKGSGYCPFGYLPPIWKDVSFVPSCIASGKIATAKVFADHYPRTDTIDSGEVVLGDDPREGFLPSDTFYCPVLHATRDKREISKSSIAKLLESPNVDVAAFKFALNGFGAHIRELHRKCYPFVVPDIRKLSWHSLGDRTLLYCYSNIVTNILRSSRSSKYETQSSSEEQGNKRFQDTLDLIDFLVNGDDDERDFACRDFCSDSSSILYRGSFGSFGECGLMPLAVCFSHHDYVGDGFCTLARLLIQKCRADVDDCKRFYCAERGHLDFDDIDKPFRHRLKIAGRDTPDDSDHRDSIQRFFDDEVVPANEQHISPLGRFLFIEHPLIAFLLRVGPCAQYNGGSDYVTTNNSQHCYYFMKQQPLSPTETIEEGLALLEHECAAYRNDEYKMKRVRSEYHPEFHTANLVECGKFGVHAQYPSVESQDVLLTLKAFFDAAVDIFDHNSYCNNTPNFFTKEKDGLISVWSWVATENDVGLEFDEGGDDPKIHDFKELYDIAPLPEQKFRLLKEPSGVADDESVYVNVIQVAEGFGLFRIAHYLRLYVERQRNEKM